MTPFLKTVAERIIADRGYDLENTTIVFPNQRPIIFLKEHFKTLVDRTIFMPTITCIDDLVAELSEVDIVDNVFLLFELFRIHCEIGNSKYQTFNEFIPFAEMLLRDFSEIDANLVDAKSLFANIHDIKAIGEWDVSGEELTQLQIDYLKFFESLHLYYTKLRDRLQTLGKAYAGMAYRKVAENIEAYLPFFEGKKIYFVGFNAMQQCDEIIIKTLTTGGIATMITDGDNYYFKDKQQEAGHFLRLMRQKGIKGLEENYDNFFGSDDKEITIVSCPENVLQAKATGLILQEMENTKKPDEEKFKSTAIVLADETLLTPMLNSLPKDTVANVTMGFPYIYSAIHSFAIDLFNLHINAKDKYFFHKDITSIISNIFIKTILDDETIRLTLTRRMQEKNSIYMDIDSLAGEENSNINSIKFLFSPDASSPKKFLEICHEVISLIDNSGIFTSGAFAKEQVSLSFLSKIVAHFAELLEQFHFVDNLDTLKKIYLKIAQSYRISFKGEPLKNLQILGMLETRSLDFDNIVILSANEGRLPEAKSKKSIIPLSLKYKYGMPTYKENDAIYAYHFYRLIQRCKNLWLLYCTDSGSNGKGEASRFIGQIEKELQPKYTNIKIEKKTVAYQKSTTTNDNEPKKVEKTEKIMKRIMDIATNSDKGFSPSALNIYNSCPLQYFCEKILNIKEDKDPSEEIEHSTLGSVVHRALEVIFDKEKFDRGFVRADILRTQLKNIDEILEQAIEDITGNELPNEGNGYLFRSIARRRVKDFVSKQIDEINNGTSIQIIELEWGGNSKSVPKPYLCINGTKAYISGTIDRVEYVDNKLRIADYKTGSVENKELQGNILETEKENISGKWFQVMTYAWIYWNNKNKKINSPTMYAGIYPLKQPSKGFMEISINDGDKNNSTNEITSDIIEKFQTMLEHTVGEILDKDTPFVAKPKNDVCRTCRFKIFCGTDKGN